MSWLKIILFSLLVILLWLIQSSFFPATNSWLIHLDLIVALVIWLSFLGSPYWWLAALIGGIMSDLNGGLVGINLITLFILAGMVIYLRKHVATTGRIGQFMFITAISLLMEIFILFTLNWLFSKVTSLPLFVNWLKFDFSYVWHKIAAIILVNLSILTFVYYFYLKRIKLFLVR